MKARVAIDIACNDPDNGLFDYRAGMITLGDDIELESDNWIDGYRFVDLGDAIRLHRRKFKIVASKGWIGNWCWNRYWMERAEAKRFVLMLRTSGRWRCTSGPSRWYEWFNREGRYAVEQAANEVRP